MLQIALYQAVALEGDTLVPFSTLFGIMHPGLLLADCLIVQPIADLD